METTAIKEIASMNNTAKQVFEKLGERRRFRKETNLSRLALEPGLDYDELMETFKKLQELGLGSIVVGRGNRPTKFMWGYDLKDVAKASKGQLNPAKMKPINQISRPATKPITYVHPITQKDPDLQLIIFNPRTKEHKKYSLNPDKEDLLMEMLPLFIV